jgi:hypothetical protein
MLFTPWNIKLTFHVYSVTYQGIEVAIRKATTKEYIDKYGRNITVVKIGKTSLTSLTSLTTQNHEGKWIISSRILGQLMIMILNVYRILNL